MRAASANAELLGACNYKLQGFRMFLTQVCNTTKNVFLVFKDGYDTAIVAIIALKRAGCSWFDSSVSAIGQYCFSSVTVSGPPEPPKAWVNASSLQLVASKQQLASFLFV